MAGDSDYGSWSNHTPMTRGNTVRLEDEVDLLDPPTKYIELRSFGPHTSYMNIWFDILTKTGKKVSIPRVCLDYNPKTEQLERNICPYRASGLGRQQQRYLSNVIVRDLVGVGRSSKPTMSETKPFKIGSQTYYFKEIGSKTHTPVRCLLAPPTLVDKLKDLRQLNKVNTKEGVKTFDIAHPKFGCDFSLKFNPEGKGGDMWQPQIGSRTPIRPEEEKYLIYRLDNLQSIKPVGRDEAQRDMEELEKIIIVKDKDKNSGEDRYNRDDRSSRNSRGRDDRDERPARIVRNSRDEQPSRNSRSNSEEPSRSSREEPSRNSRPSREEPTRNTRSNREEPARNTRSNREEPSRNSRGRNDRDDRPARNAKEGNNRRGKNPDDYLVNAFDALEDI